MAASRSILDSALDALAWLVGHGLFRTVDITGATRIPDDRPCIIVANHFNGMVDAVLLAVIVRGVPRFVAKATLWRSLLLRPLLALAGLVPVSRPEDHEGSEIDNATLFGRAHDLLAHGGMLAIFPEGTTHDHMELQRVRTGAARIALGAHDVGVKRIVIVPIGLTFDDKLALRSRVLARVGQPIDVDGWISEQLRSDAQAAHEVAGEGVDRTFARALTETVRRRLAETTPRYTDALDRAMLSRAADVRLRTDLDRPDQIVPFASREALAQAIADAPDAARHDVLDALGTYQVQLDLLRLRDEQLMPPVRASWLLRRALGLTVYMVVLGVVVVFGVAVNIIPTVLTALAGRRPAAPVTKGTMRVLTALFVFPLAWVVVAIATPVTGVLPTMAVFLACPIAGGVAVGGLERAIALMRAWSGWLGLRNTRGLLDRIYAARRRVCERVDVAAAQRLG
jgi:glycerol-3-phosphate O-acyltransferase/dihydroxyacetone phosphate acyltransferase